jgi:hypothetical protein
LRSRGRHKRAARDRAALDPFRPPIRASSGSPKEIRRQRCDLIRVPTLRRFRRPNQSGSATYGAVLAHERLLQRCLLIGAYTLSSSHCGNARQSPEEPQRASVLRRQRPRGRNPHPDSTSSASSKITGR